jgi:ABC-type multidrug transport system ATPase subunit
MIEVQHVRKTFGRLKALDDISFAVQPGEVVALWGANGAGKTTLIRCLLNLIAFDGSISMAGLDIRRSGKIVRQQIGFVPQELTFHDDLTVEDTFYFYARLKKLGQDFEGTPLIESLQLTPHLSKMVGDLSGGLKQRLALGLALLSDPPILLLDEPTANLDIQARETFLALLLELKRQGKTMIFSSHRLAEMATLADRVIYLVDGQIAADCPPIELRERLGWQSTLHLTMAQEGIDPALSILTGSGLNARRNGVGVFVTVPAGHKGEPLQLLYEAGIEVIDFSID